MQHNSLCRGVYVMFNVHIRIYLILLFPYYLSANQIRLSFRDIIIRKYCIIISLKMRKKCDRVHNLLIIFFLY